MKPNALSIYGGREDIRELTERLQKMMPGTTKLTPTEALTVAQIAVAHGLDPFAGEVWGLKGENEKWYGCMIGIKGLRKAAMRQINQEGGVYWIEGPIRVDPKKYSAPETAVVYEAILRDTVSTKAYSDSLHGLIAASVPYVEAVKMLGPAPFWTGVGIATPEEKSKMGIHQRARKRAESDALKQRFSVSMEGISYIEGGEIPADALPTITLISEPEPQAEPEQAARTEGEILEQLGFDVDV